MSMNLTVRLSPSKKDCFICFNENPLKTIENTFYFILKALFRSQDISVFVLNLRSCRKNGMIRKVRLLSEFMVS